MANGCLDKPLRPGRPWQLGVQSPRPSMSNLLPRWVTESDPNQILPGKSDQNQPIEPK